MVKERDLPATLGSANVARGRCMEPFDLNCLFQSTKVGILGSFNTELRRRDIEVVEEKGCIFTLLSSSVAIVQPASQPATAMTTFWLTLKTGTGTLPMHCMMCLFNASKVYQMLIIIIRLLAIYTHPGHAGQVL